MANIVQPRIVLGIILLAVACVTTGNETCKITDGHPTKECEDCNYKWSSLLQTLATGEQEKFKSVIWPFANATKNTYTWRLEEPITGWTLIRERNPESGMHALAYQNNEDETMVMIAIRGTQLGGKEIEEQSDICADWWLMDRDEPAYEFCDKFTEDQMNYFQQLVEFADEVDQVVLPKKSCTIYTGHSLGALLSTLASINSYAEEPAVTFAPPGARTAAKWLGLPSVSWSSNVYSFYSQYDPITVLPGSWGNQTGTLCELEEEREPEQCEKCFADPHFDITNTTTPCGLCFMEMHIYGHYLDLIFKDNAPRSCTKILHQATSGAWSLLLKPKHGPVSLDTFYMCLSVTFTMSMTLLLLNYGGM